MIRSAQQATIIFSSSRRSLINLGDMFAPIRRDSLLDLSPWWVDLYTNWAGTLHRFSKIPGVLPKGYKLPFLP